MQMRMEDKKRKKVARKCECLLLLFSRSVSLGIDLAARLKHGVDIISPDVLAIQFIPVFVFVFFYLYVSVPTILSSARTNNNNTGFTFYFDTY